MPHASISHFLSNPGQVADRPAEREGRLVPLTRIEREFVDAYCADPSNIAEAVRKTSSRTKNHRQTGQKLLARPHVQQAIEGFKAQARERTGLTAEWVATRLMTEATNQANTGGERIRSLEILAKMLGSLQPEPGQGATSTIVLGLTNEHAEIIKRGILGIEQLPEAIDIEAVPGQT